MPSKATRLHHQFVLFAIVGVAGFVVDSAVQFLAMHYGGLGHYWSRLVSYLAAATFTWGANRYYTFAGAQRQGLAGQWLRFLLANAVGGLANLGVYAWLVAHEPLVANWPVLGIAAGSLAGLVINFFLSRTLVFRH